MEDLEVFEGKSFDELLKDIYSNSNQKKKQIDTIVKDLLTYIKSANDASLIIPLIKDCFDIGVKNDEMLVKMATVYQRHVAVDKRGLLSKSTGDSLIMTEDERKELLMNYTSNLQNQVDEIEDDAERIDEDLTDLLKKSEEMFKKEK